MIGKLDLLSFITFLGGALATASCEKETSPSLEVLAQRQEAQRLQDQKERAATVDRLKAAAIAQDKKQVAIKNLQNQIDALDKQISDARLKGGDWRGLEKAQETLEQQKYELQRQ
jgi:hypothetical protein